MPRRGRALVAILSALLLCGCRGLWPGDAGWVVSQVRQHGPYRAATLSNGKEALRFYFLPQGDCPALIRSEWVLDYVQIGRLGRFQRGEMKCEPAGVDSLQAWVRRFPRPEVLTNLPRASTYFRIVHRDETMVVVRGRFPLAELVQWPGSEDTVAFLPDEPPCRAFVEQGSGTMYYSRIAPEVLWLGSVGDGGRCPILGFAAPSEAAEGWSP